MADVGEDTEDATREGQNNLDEEGGENEGSKKPWKGKEPERKYLKPSLTVPTFYMPGAKPPPKHVLFKTKCGSFTTGMKIIERVSKRDRKGKNREEGGRRNANEEWRENMGGEGISLACPRRKEAKNEVTSSCRAAPRREHAKL